MNKLDIIIPVINEADSIPELTQRIDLVMRASNIEYGIIFVDDHSKDKTVEEIKKASNKYPIKLHIKEGKKGKAYSILEGARLSNAEYLAMIDGDLQYPPEVIGQMFKLVKKHGMVVANRKKHSTKFLRRAMSKTYSLLFGKMILGFNCDVQSGLKMFKKEVIEHIHESEVRPWTIDMTLLRTAVELGYSIGHVEIDFIHRKNGDSQIRLVRDSWEIGFSALRLKFRRRKIYKIKSNSYDSAIGAGVAHKKRRFITHTHLPHDRSALKTFQTWQKLTLFLIAGIVITGLLINAKLTAIIIVATLSLIYFADLIFSLYILIKSLHFPPEIKIKSEELGDLKNKELPIYSVLCPLYKEATILPYFIEAIDAIDWPKDKLDCLLLLEEDDKQTLDAAQSLNLPSYVRTIIVPHSLPKTKPKACNYGLAKAKGEYVVIYDAEDRPDPLQLKKAYLAFNKLGKEVYCLQSKLNYFNKNQNLLTRLFTAEYSLWFDLILPGLQSIEAIIPLGGTSNHFRTKQLKDLHGWDSFNVTEDCDLGVRLFKAGYKTALIDSTTYEEANSKMGSWLRQRSRWIKGYLQTYLVHMRDPVSFTRSHGIQALVFQLVIGMRMAFMLINPILWLATILYFVSYSLVGPAIETLYPAPVFYIAVTSLVFGNFVYLYNYMIGCARREHWSVVKFVFLVPLYWLMASVAAGIAFYQLLAKPHYWEKTSHGAHIEKQEKLRAKELARIQATAVRRERIDRLRGLAGSGLATGGVLIAASIFANFFNFLYNAYLGRSISFEEFGLISVIGSILYLLQVPLNALGRTVTHKSAYLLGKYDAPVRDFWTHIRKNSVKVSFLSAGFWVLLSPFLAEFFKADSVIPFLLFTPVWVVGTLMAVDLGYLTGNLKFAIIAGIVAVEALTKFLLVVAFVETGNISWIYAVTPLSMTVAFLAAAYAARKLRSKKTIKLNISLTRTFPKRFFATSVLASLSVVAFLSFDVILAKHYLSPQAAGEYALLSLTGKIVFFAGSLFTQFINPLVSRDEGEKKDTRDIFYKLLLATAFTVLSGFVVVGVFGNYSVPFLFGSQADPILYLLPIYAFAMASFAIGSAFVTYHQAKKQYFFAFVSFFAALVQASAVIVFPKDVQTIAEITAVVGVSYLALMAFLHLAYGALVTIARNTIDFFALFGRISRPSMAADGSLRILIYNWRDTKHVWAGGAEVYVHELAKQWIEAGHSVTLFCGNDEKNPRNEVIDGVQIIRRGGFYTVYLWAVLYYILRFRGLFDVVIESMNGAPFFTPLYARIPKFLVIHHIHQEVFRNHLTFPLDKIALFVESRLTPLFYRNQKVITISESSRKAITKLNFAQNGNLEVIHNGINKSEFKKARKTSHPSFIYMGRLKPYKNIDVAVRAFANIHADYPKAKLTVAGDGESMDSLKSLSDDLGLNGAVSFLGRVTDEEKMKNLARSWVAIQPSSFEGWGITVIEANACGTPVIASNVAGLKDSVNDGRTGLLVQAKNVKLFTKVMSDLIKDEKYRKELSSEAYEWSKKFSWEKSAEDFMQVIRSEIWNAKTAPLGRNLVIAKEKA